MEYKEIRCSILPGTKETLLLELEKFGLKPHEALVGLIELINQKNENVLKALETIQDEKINKKFKNFNDKEIDDLYKAIKSSRDKI